MRIHRPAITGSISATNLIVSGTITAEGVQVPHGTAVSSSFAQKSAVSSSFAQKTAVSSSFAQKTAVSSSFAQKSAVSSSFAQKSAVSSSFALKSAISGSFGNQSVGTADSPTFAGVTTTGTLTAQTVTAQQFHTTIVSSSILYQSGSTKFGDSSDDIHQFTGSLHLVNSGSVSGSSTSTGSFGSIYTDKNVNATAFFGTVGAGATLGGVTMDVGGTDADGDIYYRSSNVLTRLAKGNDNDTLMMNGSVPNWEAVAAFDATSVASDVKPDGDNTRNLGAADKRWANVHTADMHLDNINGIPNEIDGTEGSWTIQEGEDKLYLLNNKSGKKYSFVLKEEN